MILLKKNNQKAYFNKFKNPKEEEIWKFGVSVCGFTHEIQVGSKVEFSCLLYFALKIPVSILLSFNRFNFFKEVNVIAPSTTK